MSSGAAYRLLGVTAVASAVPGLVVAGWLTLWSAYAWGARDAAWLVSYGTVTAVALALPVAFLVLHERRAPERVLGTTTPRTRTKALSWAGGLFATLLGLLALTLVAMAGYFVWVFWSDGLLAASVYFAVIAVATLATPIAFLFSYDRWQTRNGLQQPPSNPPGVGVQD